MLSAAIRILVVVSFVAFFTYEVKGYLDLPVVYTSHSTGKCVKVVSPTGEYSCNKLPEKYSSEIVK